MNPFYCKLGLYLNGIIYTAPLLNNIVLQLQLNITFHSILPYASEDSEDSTDNSILRARLHSHSAARLADWVCKFTNHNQLGVRQSSDVLHRPYSLTATTDVCFMHCTKRVPQQRSCSSTLVLKAATKVDRCYCRLWLLWRVRSIATRCWRLL